MENKQGTIFQQIKSQIAQLKSDGGSTEEIAKLKRRYKLLKKASRCLSKEVLKELAGLYLETKKNPKLVQASIACVGKFKEPIVAQILSVLLGFLGLDRFYIRDYRSGRTKLFTLGGILVFYFYDWFVIFKRTKFNNYLALRQAMGAEVEEFDLDKLNK